MSSTQLVTDENGDQVARFIYGAWGEELYASESVPGVLENRFVGGLGCRKDAATGLIYMRHRWYDPALQRFISRDPIGLKGGANLYKYAGNNPASKVDPTGLDVVFPPELKITEAVIKMMRTQNPDLENLWQAVDPGIGPDMYNVEFYITKEQILDASGKPSPMHTEIAPSNFETIDGVTRLKPGNYKIAVNLDEMNRKSSAELTSPNWQQCTHELGHFEDAKNHPQQFVDRYNDGEYNHSGFAGAERYNITNWDVPILLNAGLINQNQANYVRSVLR